MMWNVMELCNAFIWRALNGVRKPVCLVYVQCRRLITKIGILVGKRLQPAAWSICFKSNAQVGWERSAVDESPVDHSDRSARRQRSWEASQYNNRINTLPSDWNSASTVGTKFLVPPVGCSPSQQSSSHTVGGGYFHTVIVSKFVSEIMKLFHLLAAGSRTYTCWG